MTAGLKGIGRTTMAATAILLWTALNSGCAMDTKADDSAVSSGQAFQTVQKKTDEAAMIQEDAAAGKQISAEAAQNGPSAGAEVAARAEEDRIPDLPAFMGMDLNDDPMRVDAKLLSMGYRRSRMDLESPHTHMTYTDVRSEVFPNIDMVMCNHPRLLVRMTLSGKNKKLLYELSRSRFGFEARHLDAPLDMTLLPEYARKFSGGKIIRLTESGGKAFLIVEDKDAEHLCIKLHEEDKTKFDVIERNKKTRREQERHSRF